MVSVAVVHEAPRPTWSTKQLVKAFEELGARYYYVRPSYLTVSIRGSEVRLIHKGRELNVDAVVVRNLGFPLTLDLFLKRFGSLIVAEALGCLVVNRPFSMVVARDKLMSLALLSISGIPVPPTCVTEVVTTAMDSVREWGDSVVKPISGSLGYGSFRVSDPDVAFHVFKMLADLRQPIYVQKYVEKPERDIRVFVVGERVIAAAYRYAPRGSWKTNVAQGGMAKPARVAPELEELSVKAAKVLGLDYAGIDVGETAGGYVVFEANAAPLWRGLQAATGVNPAQHIASHILSKVKR